MNRSPLATGISAVLAALALALAAGCGRAAAERRDAGDRYLDSDAVFGVKDGLVRALEQQPAGVTAQGHTIERAMVALRYDFVLAPAR